MIDKPKHGALEEAADARRFLASQTTRNMRGVSALKMPPATQRGDASGYDAIAMSRVNLQVLSEGMYVGFCQGRILMGYSRLSHVAEEPVKLDDGRILHPPVAMFVKTAFRRLTKDGQQGGITIKRRVRTKAVRMRGRDFGPVASYSLPDRTDEDTHDS